MDLVGMKTDSIYRRYEIVTEADLVEGVRRLAGYLGRPSWGTLTEFRKVVLVLDPSLASRSFDMLMVDSSKRHLGNAAYAREVFIRWFSERNQEVKQLWELSLW
jgi:hypothetical protein